MIEIKTATHPKMPPNTIWETTEPFSGLIKIGKNWKKHFFDWGAQIHVDPFGNPFYVWESGTTGRLVELPANFSMSWVRQINRGDAYKVHQLVAVVRTEKQRIRGSTMDQETIYRIAERVAGKTMTAGVSVGIAGYRPKNLWWVLTEVSKTLSLAKELFKNIDIDGMTDSDERTGVINCYLHKEVDGDGLTNATSLVQRAANDLGRGFRTKVWLDRSKMFDIPVVRLRVIDNPDDSAMLQSTSITYSTWGKILEGLGFPEGKYDMEGGSMPIDTYLNAVRHSLPMGREQVFVRQIASMAELAEKNGYTEIVWG